MTRENVINKDNSNPVTNKKAFQIWPFLDGDFSDNVKNYINSVSTNRNIILVTQQKTQCKETINEKQLSRNSSSILKAKEKETQPEKVNNGTTVSEIYNSFVREKLKNKTFSSNTKENMLFFNKTFFDFNPKLEKKMLNGISKLTNDLVKNDIAHNFALNNSKKPRGHTSSQNYKIIKPIKNIELEQKRSNSNSNRGSNNIL